MNFVPNWMSTERRYQATAKEVANFMHMLSSTIDVLSEARNAKRDSFEALDTEIGWSRPLAAKPVAVDRRGVSTPIGTIRH